MQAISRSDFQKYGCPSCGNDSSYNHLGFKTDDVLPAKCFECELEFLIFKNGLNISTVGFMNGINSEGYTTYKHPSRIEHPRIGIKKHILKK